MTFNPDADISGNVNQNTFVGGVVASNATGFLSEACTSIGVIGKTAC